MRGTGTPNVGEHASSKPASEDPVYRVSNGDAGPSGSTALASDSSPMARFSRAGSSNPISGAGGAGCEGTSRDTVIRHLAHETFGWRPTTLVLTIRRYRCSDCRHVWRQDTSWAAEPRATLSRRGLRWALEGIVVQHLTVARVAEGLGVAWNTANDAVLAEGKRALINDATRFDGVRVVGVDEHVVRHEALLFRMEVRVRHRLAVVAVG